MNEKDAVKNYQAMMTHIGDVAANGAVNQWHQYARLAWQRNGGKSDAKAKLIKLNFKPYNFPFFDIHEPIGHCKNSNKIN